MKTNTNIITGLLPSQGRRAGLYWTRSSQRLFGIWQIGVKSDTYWKKRGL